MSRKCRARIYANEASRFAAACGNVGLHRFNCGEDFATPHQQGLSFWRNGQSPRCSLQEAHAQPILQARDDFRDAGRGQARLDRHSGEAATIDDTDEHSDLVGGRGLIHDCPYRVI